MSEYNLCLWEVLEEVAENYPPGDYVDYEGEVGKLLIDVAGLLGMYGIGDIECLRQVIESGVDKWTAEEVELVKIEAEKISKQLGFDNND